MATISAEYELLVSYLWALFWNWWTLALAILAMNEVLEWQCGKSIRWVHEHRGKIAVVFIILAQALAYRDLKHSSVQIETPRQKFDVADVEGREDIEKLKKEFDPLGKPIASARFTLLVNFKDKKEAASHYLGGGVGVALGSKASVLLMGATDQHISDGEGHSRAVIDCPFDTPLMGKPIRSLSGAEYILLEFVEGFVPIDTEISGGMVVLLVNNQITLTFEIPAQTVTEKIDKGTAIRITDIQKGLSPLTTQPSPTPNKEASPH